MLELLNPYKSLGLVLIGSGNYFINFTVNIYINRFELNQLDLLKTLKSLKKPR